MLVLVDFQNDYYSKTTEMLRDRVLWSCSRPARIFKMK